jgi:hypothetical protein
MRRVTIALLGALFAMHGSAVAAADFENGFYWGFNAGVTEDEDSCNKFPVPPGYEEPADCDNSGLGWQFYLGYQVAKWISAEAGYTDLNGSDFRVVGETMSTDVTGWTLGAAVTAPYIEKLGLYLVGGAFFWDKELDLSIVGGSGTSSGDTGTDLYYGVALRYPFNEKIGISLEGKRFADIGSSEVGKGDVSLYTAGLNFRF